MPRETFGVTVTGWKNLGESLKANVADYPNLEDHCLKLVATAEKAYDLLVKRNALDAEKRQTTKELRGLLENTVDLQARFAALRLEHALDKMLQAAPPSEREKIRANFLRVAAEPAGVYALMDYVNFKGEGVSPAERYKGQGWGLLQVLEHMKPTGPAVPAFAASAAAVLTQRVQNAPPERHESQWLPGWKNRAETYVQ